MKILYVYDALCGWCYGFSVVMNQFQQKYKDSLDFEVISGGMITGERIGPIGEVASYISKAYKDVENATGVKFGEKFLNTTLAKGEAIFTSIPPAIALSVFKSLNPENSIQFASALQRAIYFDGIEPENLEAYGQIASVASAFGIDGDVFVSKMKDPLYRKHAEEDFKKSIRLGVSGFPSVFVANEDRYYKIGSGYLPFNILESNFLTINNRK
jgi:putative protein-disulfide isomerase